MEIQANKIKKFNKPAIGLLLGIITPVLFFLFYYLYMTTKNDNGLNLGLIDFMKLLKLKDSIIAVSTVCLLPNFIWFTIFKKQNYWYAMKGLIVAVFICTMIIFITKFV